MGINNKDICPCCGHSKSCTLHICDKSECVENKKLEKQLAAAKKENETTIEIRAREIAAVMLEPAIKSWRADNTRLRELIRETIKAWESLLDNKHYPPAVIAKWLKNEMAPVIKTLRRIFRGEGSE